MTNITLTLEPPSRVRYVPATNTYDIASGSSATFQPGDSLWWIAKLEWDGPLPLVPNSSTRRLYPSEFVASWSHKRSAPWSCNIPPYTCEFCFDDYCDPPPSPGDPTSPFPNCCCPSGVCSLGIDASWTSFISSSVFNCGGSQVFGSGYHPEDSANWIRFATAKGGVGGAGLTDQSCMCTAWSETVTIYVWDNWGLTGGRSVSGSYTWQPPPPGCTYYPGVDITICCAGGGGTTPSLSTSADPPLSNASRDIIDRATLGGVTSTAGGTLTFNLYNNSGCAGTPVYTVTRNVFGPGHYNSGYVSNLPGGTYYWVASYSGDANNAAVAGVCGAPNESVTVGGATAFVDVNTLVRTKSPSVYVDVNTLIRPKPPGVYVDVNTLLRTKSPHRLAGERVLISWIGM